MKVTDPAKSNSTGWFKDPVTGDDLTGNEVRDVTCAPGQQFAWPTAIMSDEKAYQLCSRLWNEDEKACYKEYRNKGKAKQSVVQKVRETVPEVEAVEAPVQEPAASAEQVQEAEEAWEDVEPDTELHKGVVVIYDPEAVSVKSTDEVVAEAALCIGTEQIAGITYALLQNLGSQVTRYVPRSLIPDSRFQELLEAAR